MKLTRDIHYNPSIFPLNQTNTIIGSVSEIHAILYNCIEKSLFPGRKSVYVDVGGFWRKETENLEL